MLMIFLKRFSVIVFLIFLISCGTARGVLYGAGTVLRSATDARTVGNWIKKLASFQLNIC